jgi:dolichol kinase
MEFYISLVIFIVLVLLFFIFHYFNNIGLKVKLIKEQIKLKIFEEIIKMLENKRNK